MRKVAVIFGGRSCENEISILTGVFVLNVLDREKYLPVPVYIHTDGEMYTSPKMTDLNAFKKKQYGEFQKIIFDKGSMYAVNPAKRRLKKLYTIDAALNCCHGGLGEGGGVSALMEWNNIPFASPDLTPSGVFMDKALTKIVMRGLGVPTVDYIRVNERDYEKRGAFLLRRIENRLKYPVVIKPAHLGSSIGITVAQNEEEFKEGLEQAFRLDCRVVVEKYLQNKKDVNCAAYSLNGEIFVSDAEAAFGEGLYSFEEKYIKRTKDDKMRKQGGMDGLSRDLREKIRTYTKTVYKRMDLKGVVRMDFLVSGNEVYLCEVNTVPGSLAYYLFCERISDARIFFADLLENAIQEDLANKKKILSTGILHTVRTFTK